MVRRVGRRDRIHERSGAHSRRVRAEAKQHGDAATVDNQKVESCRSPNGSFGDLPVSFDVNDTRWTMKWVLAVAVVICSIG